MENKGFIIKIIAGDYTIFNPVTNEILISKPRGNFRFKNDYLKVGDNVIYSKTGDTISIEKRLPRVNDLVRPSICNIDQAIVVFSVKEPELNLNLLDKFLAVMAFNNIKTVIIFNKIDLINMDEQIEKIIIYYENIGYEVIKTSALNNAVDNLKNIIAGKISVITGQSGVGKSSLLNVLDENLNLKTDKISKALGRGKHTTRFVELLKIDQGWVADTPGFGTIDFNDFDEMALAHSFVDFFDVSKNCKYKGCLHINEPGCCVKKAVEDGQILKSRYENYCLFNKAIKEKERY